MLKSCSRCGHIHARGDPCPVKCVKVVEKQNKEIVRFRNGQLWKRMREHIKERDKFLCVYCLKKLQVLNAEELSAHHIDPLEEKGIDKADDLYGATINRYCMLRAEELELLAKLQRLKQQINAKRKMQSDIEKENVMTIASALRSIPKKVDEDADPLKEILNGRIG